VTLSLLLAQAATLNRSHLGITGYLAGGWIVNRGSKKKAPESNTTGANNAHNNSNNHNNHNSNHNNNHRSGNSKQKSSPDSLLHRQPPEWVPRKRYKKGDVVAFEGLFYKATTNNPEGKPYDFYLRMTHDLFRNELGHPATSKVVAFVSTVQFGLISSLILMVLFYQLVAPGDDAGGEGRVPCLLWVLAANLVAVYGTVSVAVPDYAEVGRLADEIGEDEE